ncbi:hypothetical protein BaRGS_00039981 [Batillaria attramentaria]|uniref:G-protein coupled receptors family 2 profile 2 domain-containing protein n=1 Tax=Batillaria attramentaria TaxID=370345 RepID=A0ABD0J1M5_9CAEN
MVLVLPAPKGRLPWTNNDSDLANYMFLMATGNETLPAHDQFVLTKISLTGCGLSIVGALLSVFLVCYVPMKSDGLFSIGNMCLALLASQLAFAGAENAFPTQVMCKISAAVLHYLFLTFHCWALAYSVHLMMKLCRVLPGLRWKRRCILVAIGWVAPIVVVALTAVVDAPPTTGTAYQRGCDGDHAVYAVSSGHQARGGHQQGKHLVMTVFSLLPVSSVPWLLGLSSPTAVVMQYLFVILNSAQGLFIFLLHMLLSTQIRSLLRNRMNEGEPRQGEEIKMSKSGSTGPSHDITESSIVNVGCGMKNITSRRG